MCGDGFVTDDVSFDPFDFPELSHFLDASPMDGREFLGGGRAVEDEYGRDSGGQELTDDVNDPDEMAMFERNVGENVAEPEESSVRPSELVVGVCCGHGPGLVKKNEGVDSPPLSPLVSDGSVRDPFACF